ncbi:MAG: ArsR family transcriptional regulator [Euryarchaeota archaeon]|nr:ArsR family transcriptional regulator [Euryarchaeota archaeon]
MKDGFTKEDEKLSELLQRAGLPRNVARTLVFMRKRDEVKSIEIEKNTDLRQPEVSIAMKYLREKGWVKKRDIKKEGKGRPIHGYKLSKPFSKIVEEIERDIRNEISDKEKLIKELKSFA